MIIKTRNFIIALAILTLSFMICGIDSEAKNQKASKTQITKSTTDSKQYNSDYAGKRKSSYQNEFSIQNKSDDPTGTDIGTFSFWINNYSSSDTYSVNENYAHMSGIAVSDKNHVAFVGTSPRSINKESKVQIESLFIQIFDPTKDPDNNDTDNDNKSLNNDSDSDLSSNSNYGLKWITNGKYVVANPQIVTDAKGRFVVLFEKYVESYEGVFYTIIDPYGNTVKNITRFSPDARLNSFSSPKVEGNTITWTSCRSSDSKMYVYQLKVK